MDGQLAYNLFVMFMGLVCACVFVAGLKSGNL